MRSPLLRKLGRVPAQARHKRARCAGGGERSSSQATAGRLGVCLWGGRAGKVAQRGSRTSPRPQQRVRPHLGAGAMRRRGRQRAPGTTNRRRLSLDPVLSFLFC